jgi:hypothetical protein
MNQAGPNGFMGRNLIAVDKFSLPVNTLSVRQKAIIAYLIVCWCLAGLGQFRKNEVGADSPPAQKLIASAPFDARDVLSVASPKLKMPPLTIPNNLGGFYLASTHDLQPKPTQVFETAHNVSRLHKRMCVFLI